MLKLSATMELTLEQLKQDGWNAVSYENRTMKALQRRGLVKWFPYGKKEGFVGIWKLTDKFGGR